MAHRIFWLFCAFLPLLSSCGGGGEVYAGDDLRIAGGIVRLDLQGTTPDYTIGEIESYLSFMVPEGDLPTGWKILPAESATGHEEKGVALGGPWQGLRFTKKGSLNIPGPFDNRRFNRVAVTLALNAKADLYVELRRGNKTVLKSSRVRVAGTRRPQTEFIDIPGTLGLDETSDRLRLQVVPQGGKPTILGIDLLQSPIANWLPAASHGMGQVALNGEARSAVGLSSKNPLRSKVAAPPGANLRFAYALPNELQRARESLSIQIEVTRPDGSTVGRKRVRVKEVDRWHEVEVKLDYEGGEELTTLLTLEGARAARESLVAIASPRLERKLNDPPAVLLVTSDTHRADHLGKKSTPFLNRLADQGVRFDDCLAATNITNPSHASILTGLSTRETGVTDNITALAEEAVTLAECFQQAGYYTLASLSAKHMNHSQSGLGQGFDQVAFPPGGSSIDSPKAIAPLEKWLDEAQYRPVFAWLHVFDAHAPYDVPDSHRWLYYDRENDPYDPDLPPLQGKARYAPDPEVRDAAYLVAQYRSEVTFLDEQLARAMAHPRLANALLAVTSDHGEHLGSHDLYWTHQGLYPETLSVPLILSWPGGPSGARVDAPVDQLDLGRTLLDVAGLTWVDFPGENLLRWVENPELEAPPRFAIASHAIAAAISHEGWFLVLNLRNHGSPPRVAHQVELYRPAEDPECANNLLDKEFETACELRALLVQWLVDAPAQTLSRKSGVSDPEVLAQLAALGYAGEEQSEAHGGALFVDNPTGNDWDKRFFEQRPR
jgi:arylsulfatase